MKHLLYFILAVLIVYLIGSLLMADFLWILHTGFLGWIGAIFIILWFFLQIEKEYGGWNEEDESDDQYISKKEARKIAEDVCKEMFNIKENKYDK
ncbi:hypothetical protein ACQRD6_05005 [Prevotella sp. SGI.027]